MFAVPPARILLDKAAAVKTKMSDATISRRVDDGTLPKPIYLSPQMPRWWEDEVDAALARLPRQNPRPPLIAPEQRKHRSSERPA